MLPCMLTFSHYACLTCLLQVEYVHAFKLFEDRYPVDMQGRDIEVADAANKLINRDSKKSAKA